MKNKIILSMLLGSVMLLSCRKNAPSTPQGCPTVTFLTKVTGKTILGGNGTLSPLNLVFTYDQSGNLVQIKDDKKTTKISYGTFTFSQVEYLDNSGTIPTRYLLKVTSVVDKIYPSQTQESYYEANKLLIQAISKYTYTNGYLTEVRTSAGNTLLNVKKFTYANGNLASFDDGTGTLYRYKYGTKMNPYANSSLKFLPGEVDFASVNLVNEIEMVQKGAKITLKLAYTYNQKGDPLTVKSLAPNGVPVVDCKFEYTTYQIQCH